MKNKFKKILSILDVKHGPLSTKVILPGSCWSTAPRRRAPRCKWRCQWWACLSGSLPCRRPAPSPPGPPAPKAVTVWQNHRRRRQNVQLTKISVCWGLKFHCMLACVSALKVTLMTRSFTGSMLATRSESWPATAVPPSPVAWRGKQSPRHRHDHSATSTSLPTFTLLYFLGGGPVLELLWLTHSPGSRACKAAQRRTIGQPWLRRRPPRRSTPSCCESSAAPRSLDAFWF